MPKRSLVKELMNVDSNHIRIGAPDWRSKFARDSPEDYRLASEVINDWIVDGRMKSMFPTRSSLKKYLSGKHPNVPCDPPVLPLIAAETFNKLIDHLQGELDVSQPRE